ncbi:MAG: DNA-directed RNA polymerase subunit alpha [bacterium]|nr:DNA-directed RNA polymerase subunit alpha [bacterium]
MISIPFKPKVAEEEGNRAVINIEGLHPGYGHTIGNSLRRVLLSSLRGAAVTSVKIEGVGHEFSTVEGVLENVVEIILNLKQVRCKVYEDGPFNISLSVSGEKEVKAGDFKTPSQVEIMNTNSHIATLTNKKSRLVIEATVEAGLGYLPVEARSKEKVEIGTVALDAAFSPVRKVNYSVENMRVGDRTDYNRVKFDIETDGSVTPLEAFQKSAEILVEQFKALAEGFTRNEMEASEIVPKYKTAESSYEEKDEVTDDQDINKVKLDGLKFSNRTLNALREAGVKTVGGLSRKKEETLREVEGLGDKGIQEIKKALGNFGITLKQ